MKFHSLRAKLIGIYMIVFMLFVGVVGVTLTVSYKHNLTKMREDAVVECAKEIARMYSVGELQSVDIQSGNTVPVLNTTAKDFDAVYSYLIRRIREANVKKDAEILEEVLKHLRTMRDTWKEVMAKTANGTNVAVS